MKTGVELIAEERQRQIEKEGYSAENDRQYTNNELARAAATYAMPNAYFRGEGYMGAPKTWPFCWESWKPTPENRVKELQKAGALIAAEIDRIQNI